MFDHDNVAMEITTATMQSERPISNEASCQPSIMSDVGGDKIK